MIDYTTLSEPALLDAVGTDAQKWAEAFCQIAKTHGLDIDEGWMITWFSNAMMAEHGRIMNDQANG